MSSDDMLGRLRQTKTLADDAKAKANAEMAAQTKINMDMRNEALARWRALDGLLVEAMRPINEASDLGVMVAITRTGSGFPIGAMYRLQASKQRGQGAASRTFSMDHDYAVMVSVDRPSVGGFSPGTPTFTKGTPEAIAQIVEEMVASVLKIG